MGVINVTPDSFSDGGRFFAVDEAVAHGLQLVREGADILDIGGESTRPRAVPVDEAEELRRVLPVVERLAREVRVPLSIDTRKPAVARAALAAGASLVNDVGAGRSDGEMADLVARSGAGYVVMHMQGEPSTMQESPVYGDVVREVGEFFTRQVERLTGAGVREEQIALDVGIGFGKSGEHNLQLLVGLRQFTRWQRPVLLGVSRKSFLGRVTGSGSEADRLPASLVCACWGVRQGANIIRAHDVAATRQALAMSGLLERGGVD